MKLKLALIPIILAAATAAYIAFHPGLGYVEPAFAAGEPAPLDGSGSYTIDPNHTSIYFEVTHLGLSQVHGRINSFSGHIVADAAQPANSSVEFTAQVGTIDTAVAPRDNHLRSADFFEVEKFPELTFKSTAVEPCDDGYIVDGDLTIKGVTKPVSIPFKHYGPYTMDGKEGPVTRVGIIAEPITILRSDFGVGKTDPMPDGRMGVSDEVIVRLSLEATLDK